MLDNVYELQILFSDNTTRLHFYYKTKAQTKISNCG